MKQEALFSTENSWIIDDSNRKRIFRGCNLGADCKFPAYPDGTTWNKDSLSETHSVTFTNRPFPETEADTHFSRLASIGCTLIRWTITWEAVEHEAPEVYDEDYLAYLRRMLKKAEEYNIFVFIDPHQDAWSRWTGGDGAPAWTLEAVGFDISKIEETGAAFTQQGALLGNKDYIQMSWPFNYLRYACATMFTLFFAGNTFAPDLKIEGFNAQDWLQNHFIDAMKHTARRIKDCKAVIGFGTLNEPHSGYIGISDLSELQKPNGASGTYCTAFEGMKAASGFTAKFSKCRTSQIGTVSFNDVEVNANCTSLFKDGFSCPWKAAGVWTIQDNKPVLLKKDYFSIVNNKPVNFTEQFLKPFQKAFIESLSQKHSHYLFFVEGIPFAERANWQRETDAQANSVVDAFHWYDGKTLLFKKWQNWLTADSETRKIVLGREKTARSFTEQIGRTADKIRSENIPPLLGEFGIPFDLNKKKSYTTDDYSDQIEALGMYYDALDELLLSATVWNYTATNTHLHGDGWNDEDLSIFCSTTNKLRGEKGFCRPYPIATAGTPIRMKFNYEAEISFEYEWESAACSPDKENEVTEIFVPHIQFPSGWKVTFFNGVGTVTEKPEQQRLFVKTLTAQKCMLKISAK